MDIIACSVIHYLDKPSSFNQDLVENLVSTITEKGYSARIHRVNLSDPLSCYADLLKSQNIDKALLLSPHTVEIPRIFIENSIRNVSLFPVFPADYGVQILDNPADLPLLLEHLYKKGHRRISYMGQCEINWTNMERCAAYYRFAAEKGIRIEHSWFIPLSYDRKTLFKNMDDAFSNTKKRPSALVAHDIIFFFLQEYFAERKMAIGKDVSIGLMESSVFGSKYAKHQALGAPLSYLDRNLKGVAELALANLEAGIPGSRENICLYAPSKLIDQHEIHTKNKGGRNGTEGKS